MLSDVEIIEAMRAGDIIIDPYPADRDIQPASIDVHLGKRFGVLQTPLHRIARIVDPSEVEYREGPLRLYPYGFALGQLAERVTISERYVARIEGKSSNGRKGLTIHVTAGFVDPGWDGILTVELFNASNITYILQAGDPIGQLAFDRLLIASSRPYGHKDLGSHYQGAKEVQG